jgi:hypothetical protein
MGLDLNALYFLIEIRIRRERRKLHDGWKATVYKLGHPVVSCIAHWASDAVNGALEELRCWALKKENQLEQEQIAEHVAGSGAIEDGGAPLFAEQDHPGGLPTDCATGDPSDQRSLSQDGSDGRKGLSTAKGDAQGTGRARRAPGARNRGGGKGAKRPNKKKKPGTTHKGDSK